MSILALAVRTALAQGAFAKRCSPGVRPLSRHGPTATRISRKVGNPTAAVILLTCRFLPSQMESSSQESLTDFRDRIGG